MCILPQATPVRRRHPYSAPRATEVGPESLPALVGAREEDGKCCNLFLKISSAMYFPKNIAKRNVGSLFFENVHLTFLEIMGPIFLKMLVPLIFLKYCSQFFLNVDNIFPS